MIQPVATALRTAALVAVRSLWVASLLMLSSACPDEPAPEEEGCECIPKAEWGPEWNFRQMCWGCQLEWGCRNDKQVYHCGYDRPWECYTVVVDEEVGCPRPELERCDLVCYSPDAASWHDATVVPEEGGVAEDSN